MVSGTDLRDILFLYGYNSSSTDKVLLLKILHVYKTYFPSSQGGLEETIRQICHNTAEFGIETRIVAPTKNPKEKWVQFEKSEVHQPKLSFEIASCAFSWEMFIHYKKQTDWADVIHYHFPWPFADLLHLVYRPEKPAIVTYHSDIVRQRGLLTLYRPLMKKFLSKVDRIVSTSPNYFATSDVLANFEGKVSVIPFGIDPETYPKLSQDTLASVRSEFGEGFYLFVGVLRYYKGLHILLEAVKDASYKVVIAGSGPTEDALKRQAKELGLTNVVFAGYVSDDVKVALFQLSCAVVFPSYLRAEAFGVTLLEGAMYGRPLISTEVGSGTSHVNVHGETGLVVTPGSSKSLRRAMDNLYHRKDLAARMGKESRRRFDRLFTGKLMGQRYYALYQSVSGLSEPISLEKESREPIAHQR